MRDVLTQKQALFVAEYLKDLNATRAAMAAGYSAASAYSQGCRLLKNAKVAAAVAKRQGKRLEKLDISAEWVLRELRLLAGANMMDYMTISKNGQADVDFSRLSRDQAAAIQEITVDTTGGSGDGERRLVLRTKFKLGDKRGSLELLGRHLKLFTDRLEVESFDGLAAAIERARKRAANR